MEATRTIRTLWRWGGLFLCLTILCPSGAYGAGVWQKSLKTLTRSDKPHFEPTFIILKYGIFSQNGWIRFLRKDEIFSADCPKSSQLVGWITHRLSPKEALTPKSGRRLGTKILGREDLKCLTGIELDIEPMAHPPKWLLPFLAELRSKLPNDLRLSLAIPAISNKKISGLHWTPGQAMEILAVIDGLDLMVYDTGSRTVSKYAALVHEALSFARLAFTKHPKKQITIGLPAYKDKTALHRMKIENLENAFGAFKNFPHLDVFCHPNVRFAYYAGWTMDSSDREFANKINHWRENVCGKKRKS